MTQVVLYRDPYRGRWMASYAGRSAIATMFDSGEPAGDVARKIARSLPGCRVGVRSESIGPTTSLTYGPVVWLTPGFER